MNNHIPQLPEGDVRPVIQFLCAGCRETSQAVGSTGIPMTTERWSRLRRISSIDGLSLASFARATNVGNVSVAISSESYDLLKSIKPSWTGPLKV